MKLVSLQIKGFRCLRNTSLNLRDLTVLIGENDAGKSSILDAIEIALSGNSPDPGDYHSYISHETDVDDIQDDQIEIMLVFCPDTWDAETLDGFLALDGWFYIRRIFTLDGQVTYYKSSRFVDEQLNQDPKSWNATEFDSVLTERGIEIEGRRNQERRITALTEFKKTAKTVEDWIEINFRNIRDKLPIFQRYRAMDYTSPESFVTKTLQAIYESLIFEEGESGRRPIESLRELRRVVRERVDHKVKELLAFIQAYHPRAKDIRIDADLDFTRGFRAGEFQIDDGRGHHSLSKVGDGTKRRILMGTVDWDRDALQSSINAQTIIRAYDEPDTNLYYEAQRKLFDSIVQITRVAGDKEDRSYRIQSLVCTHSLLMVDRAPAQSINLLTLNDLGQTEINYLQTDGDEAIEQFLHHLARELGISNTMLFYERCYLVVEGETEENALPLLYRRLYGSSILDDGIRIINLSGHGAWLSLLTLLGKNRQHITLSLLDSDIRDQKETDFSRAGFQEQWFSTNCFWAGSEEFEDEFPDDVICSCLDRIYTRIDGNGWETHEIADIRRIASEGKKKKDKFSEQLGRTVNRETHGGTTFSKAMFGYELGQHCPTDKVPQNIRMLFRKARQLVGLK